jgi:hypothetical protein
MPRHAATSRRRGVAAWPFVVAVLVLLLIAAVVVYFVVARKKPETAACTGSSTLTVVTTPTLSPAVNAAAKAFNTPDREARSTCVRATVTTVDGATTAAALSAGWKGRNDTPPDIWVLDDPADLDTVDTNRSDLTAGHSTVPIATSPVVLAVRSADATANLDWSPARRARSPPIR